MRVAAIDIGTNTVLLLVADVENGMLHVVRDDHAIARLGEGVDRTQTINEAAYKRLIEILRIHRHTTQELHCDKISAITTSAMRDAKNRDDIIRRANLDTEIEIELLSGEDEARWTYRGAILGMENIGDRIAVVDVGGGSTEISFGNGREFISGTSFNMGAVRITERFFSGGQAPSEKEKATTFVREILSEDSDLHKSSLAIDTLVAVAGTPTTLAAMHLNLPSFEAKEVHEHILTRDNIEELSSVLFSITSEQLLQRYPSVNKARADILPGGTLILREIMDHLNMPQITISTQGLRYGIALRAARL